MPLHKRWVYPTWTVETIIAKRAWLKLKWMVYYIWLLNSTLSTPNKSVHFQSQKHSSNGCIDVIIPQEPGNTCLRNCRAISREHTIQCRLIERWQQQVNWLWHCIWLILTIYPPSISKAHIVPAGDIRLGIQLGLVLAYCWVGSFDAACQGTKLDLETVSWTII